MLAAMPAAVSENTREKLFGDGPLLPGTHPAARYRDIEAFKRWQARRVAAEASAPVEAAMV